MPQGVNKDITGQKFNKLLVLGKLPQGRGQHRRLLWECSCDCGKITLANSTQLHKGLKQSCGCYYKERAQQKGNKHSNWKGYGNISGNYMGQIKSKVKAKQWEFDLTAEFLWKLFESQNGKCALTGWDIHIKQSVRTNEVQTASLDRIDSKKGYVKDNVHWIHKDINKMKNCYNIEYYKTCCQAVADYAKSRA